ncbi:ATP-binding cassette domain-containing protein [Spirobacillus cienkowskii]|jgi:iron complex transport system ATP-binding protein|uniref:ABC transporter ATP-binding protein n=1 Tax=Spirobacillus cienkowskii TaxID=495820 RepID=A0A369KVD4_9BACT|nr:MAG: ABC transporter ATP-binding protein [Spirobacillus cienkowskii]
MNYFEIKAENLAYITNFGDVLVRNVNFLFKSGDIICLIGKNGSGKSTLLKLCSGILRNYYGNLTLNNQNVKNFLNNTHISWLPQNLPRPENFNVKEFLYLNEDFLNNKTLSYNKKEIDYFRVLSDFGLSHLEKRELIQLSGGEWKMVQLARIWAYKSKIIFLDEPENDLDISCKNTLIHKIKKIACQNNSIVFIATHNLLFVKELANNICVLNNGLWVWNSRSEIFWNSKIIQKTFGVDSYLKIFNN